MRISGIDKERYSDNTLSSSTVIGLRTSLHNSRCWVHSLRCLLWVSAFSLEGLTRYWRDLFERKVARVVQGACYIAEAFGFELRMEW